MPSAAEVSRWIVLDEDDRVVGASESAQQDFAPLMGESLWESFPNARAVFGPYCERARRTGEIVELVEFFEGTLKRVRYAPQGSQVIAIWENLASVDVSSVEALRTSLAEIELALAESQGEATAQPPPLRVLEGGA